MFGDTPRILPQKIARATIQIREHQKSYDNWTRKLEKSTDPYYHKKRQYDEAFCLFLNYCIKETLEQIALLPPGDPQNSAMYHLLNDLVDIYGLYREQWRAIPDDDFQWLRRLLLSETYLYPIEWVMKYVLGSYRDLKWDYNYRKERGMVHG